MKKLLISLIDIYQDYLSFDSGLLSTLTPGGVCKYPISCSEYTKEAIREFGAAKGSWLGLKRVWRCR